MSLTFEQMQKRAAEAERAAAEKVSKARDDIANARRRGDGAAEEAGLRLLREGEADLAHAREMRSDPDLHLTAEERMARGAREVAFGGRGRRR